MTSDATSNRAPTRPPSRAVPPVHERHGSLHRNGWRILLTDLKVNEAALLRRAKLPDDLFRCDEPRMDTAAYFGLWTALEQETAHTTTPLPLSIASAMSVEWFDPTLVAVLSSNDLDAALPRLVHFKQLCAPVALDVVRTPEAVTISVKWLGTLLPAPAALVASELVFLVAFARLATRAALRPLRVSLPESLDQLDAYATYFGVRPTKGAVHSLTFGAADATMPFLTANEGIWSLFEPELRRRLHDLGGDSMVSTRVRSALLDLLPTGDPSMKSVARKLGLSTRTLQRRLQDEGHSFQQTLDAVRTELAIHYLRHTALTGVEIALKLGFEDPNSFVRAFRDWTGSTPHRKRFALLDG